MSPRIKILPRYDLSILIISCISSDITERAPTVRDVTSPVSCAQDQGLSPAGSVHLPFWSCKAPNCALSTARNASISSMTSANSATPVVRPAQVQMENWKSCNKLFLNQLKLYLLSLPLQCVNIRHFVGGIGLWMSVCCRCHTCGLHDVWLGQHSKGQSLLSAVWGAAILFSWGVLLRNDWMTASFHAEPSHSYHMKVRVLGCQLIHFCVNTTSQ